jgi:hypothetical protein
MSSIAQSSTSSQLVFDPRHSRLRRFSFIVLAVALIATGYLSYAELTKSSLVCLGGSNSCDIVTNSAWSRFYGVPVSYLGFAAWIIMGATLLLETRVKVVRELRRHSHLRRGAVLLPLPLLSDVRLPDDHSRRLPVVLDGARLHGDHAHPGVAAALFEHVRAPTHQPIKSKKDRDACVARDP